MPTIEEMRADLASDIKKPTIEEMRADLAKDKSFNPNQPFKSDGSSYIDKFRNNNEKSGEKAQAQLESFGNSLALGYAPNLQALVSASLDPNYFVDKKLESQGIKINQPSFKERYIADRDQNAARQEQQRKDFPVSTGGASLAGGVIGGIATSPLIPIPMAAKAGTPLLKLVAKGAGVGALQGAGYGAVSNPGETKGEISPLQLGDRASNALTGAEFGAVIGGGAPLVSAAINKAPAAGRYLLSKVGGVDPEISKTYWNNMDRINNSKTPAELKDISDEFVGNLYDDVQSKKIDLQNARLALKEYSDNLKQKYKDLGYEAKIAEQKAKSDLVEAHAKAVDAHKNNLEGLKESSITSKESLGNANRSNIENVAKGLDEDIISFQRSINDRSKAATELITQDNVKLPIQPIVDKLDAMIEAESIINNKPGGAKTKQAVDYLKNLRSTLVGGAGDESRPIKTINDVFESIGKNSQKQTVLDGKKSKQLIQQISKDADYNIGSGAYNEDKNRVIKEIRREIDQMLKSDEFGSPRYKAAMIPIAEDSAILENASKHFPDRLSSQSTLSRVGSVSNAEEANALKLLSQKTGKDYIALLSQEGLPEYSANNSVLESIAKAKKSLPVKQKTPEYEALQRAGAKTQLFSSRNIGKTVEKSVSSSPINQQIAQAETALTRAQENLEPYTKLIPKSVGSQAERLIKTLGDGKTPIDTERMFTELGKLSGTDFVQAMKDQKVLQTFNEASKRNPAIKTIMSLVGAAVGYHYGGYGGLTTGVGSTVAANAFGPKAVKSILDGAKKLSMNPTVKNLTTLDLPPEVKANWANMIKQGVIRNGPPEGKK